MYGKHRSPSWIVSFNAEVLYALGQQTRTFIEAVEQYAQLGLRTLCLAWRELKEEEYLEWSMMFKEANSTLVDREVRSKSYDLLTTTCLFLSSNCELNSTFLIFLLLFSGK